MGKKKNCLLEKIVEIVSHYDRGKVLDLGCGDGRTVKRLFDMGFAVEPFDLDKERFEFHGEIPFTVGDLKSPLPYEDNSFDCVIFMEVIEHIYNPNFVISEIYRVLRKGGRLVLSTPNILNVGSRLRFLLEGAFDFFSRTTIRFFEMFSRVDSKYACDPLEIPRIGIFTCSK